MKWPQMIALGGEAIDYCNHFAGEESRLARAVQASSNLKFLCHVNRRLLNRF